MLTDKDMLNRMKNGWRGGLPETICGVGSTLASTENIRRWLPEILERYSIRSLNDAGAGDGHWMARLLREIEIDYRAFDLVVRRADVEPLDITRELLPYADAILCRHTLNHLGIERVAAALSLFRESGARYLIATQFDQQQIDAREFTRLDLRLHLGEPLEATHDGGVEHCRLAIWAIP